MKKILAAVAITALSMGAQAGVVDLSLGGGSSATYTFKGLTSDSIYRLNLDVGRDRKSTRLNSSHSQQSRMPSSA